MRHTLALIFLIAGLILTLPGSQLGQEPTEPPQLSQHPKLHFRLQDLVNQGTLPVSQKTGLVRIDDLGRVQVYIRPVSGTQVQAILDQIISLGARLMDKVSE